MNFPKTIDTIMKWPLKFEWHTLSALLAMLPRTAMLASPAFWLSDELSFNSCLSDLKPNLNISGSDYPWSSSSLGSQLANQSILVPGYKWTSPCPKVSTMQQMSDFQWVKTISTIKLFQRMIGSAATDRNSSETHHSQAVTNHTTCYRSWFVLV
jgi:hypothetical protein